MKEIGGKAASLSDVYVEPRCTFLPDNNFKVGKETFNDFIVLSFVDHFIKELLEKENYIEKARPNAPYEVPRLLIIEGEGGMGKSSLSSMLAHHYLNTSRREAKKSFVFYKLRNMEVSAKDKRAIDFVEVLITELKTNYRIADFRNSILVLDGFDELCMLADMKDKSAIFNIIDDLIHFLNQNECKCIVTTRPNIIPHNSPTDALVIKLNLFTYASIKTWIEKYKQMHPAIPVEVVKKYENYARNDKKESSLVFKIPLTNYIAFCLSILDKDFDISRYSNIFQIYDEIFGENSLLFTRIYDVYKHHPSSKYRKQIRELTMQIAVTMFNSNRLFINQTEVEELIYNDEFGGIFKQIDREWLSANYGIVFYINSNNGIIEFLHKTIYEYFAMEHFFLQLVSAYKKANDAYKMHLLKEDDYLMLYNSVYSMFAHNYLTEQMLEFFSCRLEKLIDYDGLLYLEEQFGIMKKCFIHFLVSDPPVYSNKYKTHSIKHAKSLFVNLWNITDMLYRLIYAKDGSERLGICKVFSQSDIDIINTATEFKELFNLTHSQIKRMLYHHLPSINLSKINIENFMFSYDDLSNANFSGSQLLYVRFENTVLTETAFMDCHIDHVKYDSVSFDKARIKKSVISDTKFTDVVLNDSDIIDTNFYKCTFINTSFYGATLESISFKDCIFKNVDLRKASITGCSFQGEFTKISLCRSSYGNFSNYHLPSKNFTVYREDDPNELATYDDILEELNKEYKVKVKTIEGGSEELLDAITDTEDLRTIDLQYQITKLTNDKIISSFMEIVYRLFEDAPVDDILESYDISEGELEKVVTLYNKMKIVNGYSVKQELLKDFSNVLKMVSKQLPIAKILKKTHFTAEELGLIISGYKAFSHHSISVGEQEMLHKVRLIVGKMQDSLEDNLKIQFDKSDKYLFEIYKKSGLIHLHKYIHLCKWIAKNIREDIVHRNEGQVQVIVIHPLRMEDASNICVQLKQNIACVVDFRDASSENAKRIIDFLSGAAYALGGQMRRVAVDIYIVVPDRLHLEGESEEEWADWLPVTEQENVEAKIEERNGVYHPVDLLDAMSICDSVKINQSCVVDLMGAGSVNGQCIMDFISGFAFALDGTVQFIAPKRVTVRL